MRRPAPLTRREREIVDVLHRRGCGAPPRIVASTRILERGRAASEPDAFLDPKPLPSLVAASKAAFEGGARCGAGAPR